jgi:hypothetical protein
LPPIIRHFEAIPGSLVCDVMLHAVPNGDVVYGNVGSTVMWGLGQHALILGIIDLKWGLQQWAFFNIWGGYVF